MSKTKNTSKKKAVLPPPKRKKKDGASSSAPPQAPAFMFENVLISNLYHASDAVIHHLEDHAPAKEQSADQPQQPKRRAPRATPKPSEAVRTQLADMVPRAIAEMTQKWQDSHNVLVSLAQALGIEVPDVPPLSDFMQSFIVLSSQAPRIPSEEVGVSTINNDERHDEDAGDERVDGEEETDEEESDSN